MTAIGVNNTVIGWAVARAEGGEAGEWRPLKRHMCPAFLSLVPPSPPSPFPSDSQKGSRHVTLSECLIRLMQLKSFSANEMAPLASQGEQEIKSKGGGEKDGSRCPLFHNDGDAASKQYEGPTKPRLITSISPTTSTGYTRTPPPPPRRRRKSHASRAHPRLHRVHHGSVGRSGGGKGQPPTPRSLSLHCNRSRWRELTRPIARF